MTHFCVLELVEHFASLKLNRSAFWCLQKWSEFAYVGLPSVLPHGLRERVAMAEVVLAGRLFSVFKLILRELTRWKDSLLVQHEVTVTVQSKTWRN